MVAAFSIDSGPPLVSVTYNGVNLTKDKEQTRTSPTNSPTSVWSLAAPDVGTFNAIATKTGTAGIVSLAVANYTGCKQTGLPDATVGATSESASSASYTITTVADDCWIMTSEYDQIGNINNGTNFVVLQTPTNGIYLADSNASVGVAGSKTVSFSWGSAGIYRSASASYAPSTATTTILTPSENLSNAITETLTRIWTAPRSQSEVIALQGESTTRSWSLSRGLPIDNLTITESINAFKGHVIEIAEALGIVETLSRTVSWIRSPSESVGITETVTRIRTAFANLTETLTIIENVTRTLIFGRTVSEIVSIIETLRTPLNWLKRTKPTTTWIPRTKP